MQFSFFNNKLLIAIETNHNMFEVSSFSGGQPTAR
ncbi:MAG: hypothetical protein ACLSE6_00600 [Alphaproteobacteria bacterium]